MPAKPGNAERLHGLEVAPVARDGQGGPAVGDRLVQVRPQLAERAHLGSFHTVSSIHSLAVRSFGRSVLGSIEADFCS